MFLGTMFTVPSATNLIASTSAYSGSFITEFMDLAWLPIALLVAGGIVLWVVKNVKGGIRTAMGLKKGRGRRRR